MAQYFPYSHQTSVHANNSYGYTNSSQPLHQSRQRRGPRYHGSGPHAAHLNATNKPLKHGARSAREVPEAAQLVAFRKDFEAARSFDLEDDEMFCPWHLLTEDDLHSIQSSSSDRSSSSSGSPSSSPLQQQLQPIQPLVTSSGRHSAVHLHQPASSQIKLHQPLAQRSRNAIPIVDPNSRIESPPDSASPVRHSQKNFSSRRW